jgi:hypothetical protein
MLCAVTAGEREDVEFGSEPGLLQEIVGVGRGITGGS